MSFLAEHQRLRTSIIEITAISSPLFPIYVTPLRVNLFLQELSSVDGLLGIYVKVCHMSRSQRS